MPFHQFNQFTGRLKQSKNLQPLYPIPPIPLDNSGLTEIMYDTAKTKPVKTGEAFAEKSKIPEYPPRFSPKTIEFMKKLQADITAPVYLAKGTPDKILFGLTCAIIGYGMFESLTFCWKRATKRI